MKFSNNKGDLKNVFSNRKENNIKKYVGTIVKSFIVEKVKKIFG